jgi:hypothetical protein
MYTEEVDLCFHAKNMVGTGIFPMENYILEKERNTRPGNHKEYEGLKIFTESIIHYVYPVLSSY